MTSPIQLGKTYGVLHTKSFFSFLGFAKKIGSDETQKIDVFLDNKLIDTIEANEFIQQIDDIYDVENKAFKYNLPSEYIGKKAILSFKNHDSEEELLNSPYTLIDKNNEKFNEAKFLHSLSEPIDEEKIKDIYCPNSIGFLATKENLEDEEFMGYIKELINRFPDVEFKGFCFNEIEKNILVNIKLIHCKPYIIESIENIRRGIEIFLWNYKPNDIISGNIISNVRNGTILSTFFMEGIKNLTIKDWEAKPENVIIQNIINNLKYFGFDEEEFNQANKSVLLMLNNRAKNYVHKDVWEEVYNESNLYNFMNILLVKYWLNSSSFKYFYYEIIHTKNERLV